MALIGMIMLLINWPMGVSHICALHAASWGLEIPRKLHNPPGAGGAGGTAAGTPPGTAGTGGWAQSPGVRLAAAANAKQAFFHIFMVSVPYTFESNVWGNEAGVSQCLHARRPEVRKLPATTLDPESLFAQHSAQVASLLEVCAASDGRSYVAVIKDSDAESFANPYSEFT
jgi:hypothetical protein